MFGWVLNIAIFKNFFFFSRNIDPLISVALILIGTCLLLEEKLAFSQIGNNSPDRLRPVFTLASIFCATLILAFGIAQIVGLMGEKQTFLSSGIDFSLFGVALLLPRIKASHRFHVVHLLILAIVVINMMTILNYVYQLLSPNSHVYIGNMPLTLAIMFIVAGHAIWLRWPNRGFIGMFTIDTVSSIFALRLLVIYVVFTPVVGLIGLMGLRVGLYNPYEAVAIFAILIVFLSTVLSWLNIKLLYKFELERFAMKEELRINNIDLELGSEELAVKNTELTEVNKTYVDKLNNRESMMDIGGSD